MKVLFADEQDDPLEPQALVDLATAVLAAEALPPDTEVSVTLVSEEAIAAHNAAALGNEGPTDVLSFPLEDATPGSPPQRLVGGPPVMLGDVVISPAVVKRNAVAADVRFEDEMALMVVHGMLHLLGYDHVEDGDAELMESRERELLASIDVVRP